MIKVKILIFVESKKWITFLYKLTQVKLYKRFF